MTTSYRNFRMVDYVVYGRGCLSQLDGILAPRRQGERPMVFLVDAFFKDRPLAAQLPRRGRDPIYWVDATHEPKTQDVDGIRDRIVAEHGGASGVIGVGGGSAMDMAKAVSLMLTNQGSSADYQGWDLVKRAGVYKVGIPTLSGTGAEVSRTAVLTGPVRKLGLNSDFTPFDQIVLDPDLIRGAPAEQRFYTGMDCYIHCIESLQGSFINAFSRSYGEKSQELCEEIFLRKPQWDDDADEKLMMASYAGGMSIAYSQVGVAHAVSYGLAYVLGVRHGEGNSLVFDQLEEFYPAGVRDFKEMLVRNGITLKRGLTRGLTEAQWDKMLDVSLGMGPLWENALGKDWKQQMTRDRLRRLYERI